MNGDTVACNGSSGVTCNGYSHVTCNGKENGHFCNGKENGHLCNGKENGHFCNGNVVDDDEHDTFSHYHNKPADSFNQYKCKVKTCLVEKVRYPDGSVRLRNPHIELMDQDILYHLALGSESHDLVEMFGDVKFICMGGTPKRMETFAYFIMKEIGHKLPTGTTLMDISQYSYRYSMYKVGPVLAVSHGMGVPSIGILLHEIIKLMYHAKARDPVFFRIGTCGGVGIEPGSVIISDDTVDGMMNHYYEVPTLGQLVRRPAKLDRRLVRELKAMADPEDPYETLTGTTMCAIDFYEGQGRLDGAFCDYSESEKMEYLESLRNNGIKNLEMESIPFAALTHHAGIKAAIVCVTLLDRLKGDQVCAPKEVMDEWQMRPQKLVARYIKRYLQTKGRISFDGHGSMAVKSPRRFKLVQQESETFE